MSGSVKQAEQLNLAARPFQNRRPLQRLAAVLWVAVAALTVVNGLLYYRHFAGSRLTGEQQQELRVKIAEEERRLRELSAALGQLDVAETNRQARYLNSLIVERSFSWSRLFDRLAEAMPAQVRLSALVPDFTDRDPRRRSERGSRRDETVVLEIRGTARTDTALLEFVDGLFEHESFHGPDLRSERREEKGGYSFALDVIYHPTAPGEGAAEEPGVEAEEPTAPETPGEQPPETEPASPEPGGGDGRAAAVSTAAGDE